MDTGQGLDHLRELLTKSQELANLQHADFLEKYELWHSLVKDVLMATFGASSAEIQDFSFGRGLLLPPDLLDESTKLRWRVREAQKDLQRDLTEIRKIIQRHELLGTTKPVVPKIQGVRPKVFLAHGGHTPTRDELELFLWRQGYQPVIVDELPSSGLDPSSKVEYYLGRSDFAVILAEADRASIQDGKPMPRLNIVDEMARIRAKLGDRFVLLREEGLNLPTNVNPTYETFQPGNLAKALSKVLSELKAVALTGQDEWG